MNAFVRYTVMGIYKLFYNFRIEGWENVPEKEYYKLLPMAAKAFLTNERKKMQFRNLSIYMKYTEEQWHAFYHDYSQRPRVKGFLRDLAVYEKYAKQAERFKTRELREALEACVEADENVKTGKMNDVMSVEILICKYSSNQKVSGHN